MNKGAFRLLTVSGMLVAAAQPRADDQTRLFPEPQRFPQSFVEAKQREPAPPGPVVSVLLPAKPRDVHLRACAVLGARFGQLQFLSEEDCRLAPLARWPSEMQERNGIIVARRDELETLAVPQKFREKLDSLKEGQGLLGEFITGEPPHQRRWLLVSGADDAGMEKAILTLGSAPALAEAPPNPAVIDAAPALPNGLDPKNGNGREKVALKQINQFLLADRFLRKAAFLLPEEASEEELQLLFTLAMHLGSNLRESPVVWPEAAACSLRATLPVSRLQGRSVVLLCPVLLWDSVLPKKTSLAVEVDHPVAVAERTRLPEASVAAALVLMADEVRIQGRRYRVSEFEPTLTLIQIMPSPWSREGMLVVAGGWTDAATPAVKRLLTDPQLVNQLSGDVAALDASGRMVVYDSRRASVESLAERVQQQIPPGLTLEETNQRLVEREARARHSSQANWIIFFVTATVLTLVVLSRVLLLWVIERNRKQAARAEKPLGSAA